MVHLRPRRLLRYIPRPSLKRRAFTTTNASRRAAAGESGQGQDTKKAPLFQRIRDAWKETPIKWYPLPVAGGALLLVAMQYRKRFQLDQEVQVDEEGREIIKLKGPWQVHVLGALPLRNLSRLWGYMNSLELPEWFRPYGFKMYSSIFGVNLSEVEHSDLRTYTSLGDFFYRRLKEGARPIADSVLVSPADGRMLHFGTIQDLRVEQVKGLTYSLDALLGVDTPPGTPSTEVAPHPGLPIVDDHEFANVNGIEYSVGQLLGSSASPAPSGSVPSDINARPQKHGEQIDASVEPEESLPETIAHDTSVALEIGVRPALERRTSASSVVSGKSVRPGNKLFFAVIYLAPGDYHRFHSPTAWVVEKRRHFVGELFSVSPYIARRLANLFVLNERVALLGKWRHGFFSMVPVGATNVGSIRIAFDTALRTNEKMRKRDMPPPGTYVEAVYSGASPILGGQPLTKGQEMGGFSLGSTIVLIFEAPKDFEFSVKEGEKVQVGQKLGDIVDSNNNNTDSQE